MTVHVGMMGFNVVSTHRNICHMCDICVCTMKATSAPFQSSFHGLEMIRMHPGNSDHVNKMYALKTIKNVQFKVNV